MVEIELFPGHQLLALQNWIADFLAPISIQHSLDGRRFAYFLCVLKDQKSHFPPEAKVKMQACVVRRGENYVS